MPLTPGTRLGPYEIAGPLGAGGMGEVFRAKDTRLGRDVAVKVLPPHLSANPEVRLRFEREAKTVSSLNHPNICTLFDVGREGDTDYLVMELVEGETLAHRLVKGALPAAEVLKLGAQIADALDRAHRAGVIHRDLKPGNVMLTRSGAKLMDFGLARATGLTGPGAGSGVTLAALTQSPTVAGPLTAEGTIIGTFQYMAPEQLEGKEADARSDLWALGCVLYEMATGKRAFEGASQASVIASILKEQPRPVAELAPMSPPALERLVVALLAKDPDDRVQTAHDVKLQLQWAAGEPGSTATARATPATAPRARGPRPAIAWAVAASALVLAAASWLVPGQRGGSSPATRQRLVVSEPPGHRLLGLVQSFAIAPDGSALVFVAADSTGTGRLWLRPLDELNASPIAGTENADLPFWSPDSRAIGFFSDGKLRRVAREGGKPEVLCDAPDPRGGTWGASGIIVFAPMATGPLQTVPADGGEATELLRPDSAQGEVALRFPEFLPDGKRFTFVSLPRREAGYDIHLGSVDSRDRRHLMWANAAPVAADPGWLVTMLGDKLVAQQFDAGEAKTIGKPVTLGDAPNAFGHDGVRAVTASRTGILAYATGRRSNTRLAWLDRSGHVEQMFSLPNGAWEAVVVSPDDRQALVSRTVTANEKELWLVDLASGQATRFPFPGRYQDYAVSWAPDGRSFVFQQYPNGPGDLYLQRIDGGAPELVYESSTLFKNPYDWSPDGRVLTFEQPMPGTLWDVYMMPMNGGRKPVPLVDGPANEGGGWFSPDGRWLLYYSDETGAYELYVRPFPGPGPKHVLAGSRIGASAFHRGCWWSADGREVLLQGQDGLVRSIAVDPGDTWKASPAREVFRATDDIVSICPTSDHRRFLASVQVEVTPPPAIVVDLNWNVVLHRR